MSDPQRSGQPFLSGLDPAVGRKVAVGLVALGAVSTSFGGLIVRNIDEAQTWQINLYRSLSLIVVVSAIVLIQKRGQAVAYVRGIGRPGLWGGALLAITDLAFVQSLTNTTVSNTLFTLCTIPLITAALARIFLKEQLRPVTIVTMFFAACGAAVMFAEGLRLGSIYGNIMAIVTAFGFSGFTVIVRRNRHVDMLPTILVSNIIIVAVTAVITRDSPPITWHDLMLCFLWGGMISGFANWMFIIASRHLVAAEVTLFLLLEFALGPLWVWLFVGESPAGWTLVGGAMIISAVAFRAVIELRWADRAKAGERSILG